jgi:hypothetical protein
MRILFRNYDSQIQTIVEHFTEEDEAEEGLLKSIKEKKDVIK